MVRQELWAPGKLPESTSNDLASPARGREYIARTLVPMPESEIRASRVFGPDGRFRRPRTAERILRAVANVVEHPGYEKLRDPVLAIYAVAATPVQLVPRYRHRYEGVIERPAKPSIRCLNHGSPPPRRSVSASGVLCLTRELSSSTGQAITCSFSPGLGARDEGLLGSSLMRHQPTGTRARNRNGAIASMSSPPPLNTMTSSLSGTTATRCPPRPTAS
jgi:hypothetical protein